MCSCRAVVHVDGNYFKDQTEIGHAGMTRSQFITRNPPAKKTEVYFPLRNDDNSVTYYTFHREVHWIDAQSLVEVLYHLVDTPDSGKVDSERRVDEITLSPNDVIFMLTEVRTKKQLPAKTKSGPYNSVFSLGSNSLPEIEFIGPVGVSYEPQKSRTTRRRQPWNH